jgi:vacuolar-type H+-ATPase subunit I/STV1
MPSPPNWYNEEQRAESVQRRRDMSGLQNRVRAKVQEAEALSARIRQLDRDSEEQKAEIMRWAVVGDEATRLIIQAEERLSAGQLAQLKAEINGTEPGQIDLWAKYRESEWRLPKFGAPGPGDEPPPTVPIRDLLQ